MGNYAVGRNIISDITGLEFCWGERRKKAKQKELNRTLMVLVLNYKYQYKLLKYIIILKLYALALSTEKKIEKK